MEERIKNEKEYLLSTYKDKLPDENPFIIYVSPEKELLVIGTMDDSFVELDKCSKYRTLYDTVLDLRNKIIFSLDNAIEYAYAPAVQNAYSPTHLSGEEEWLAFYHIENALFRVESLWDILAHFYNIKYDLGKKIHEVYHNRIFSNKPELFMDAQS